MKNVIIHVVSSVFHKISDCNVPIFQLHKVTFLSYNDIFFLDPLPLSDLSAKW